jgi:hypothetical protein
MNETEPLTITPATKRGSRLRWLFVTVLVLLPLLALVGIYFYIGHLADTELRDAQAEADRLDPGWRLDDLLARRPEYPLEDNSAAQAFRIKSLIPKSWAAKEEFNALFNDLPKSYQLDAAQQKALREEMAKAAAALAEARKLPDMPHGRFPLQWAPDSISTILHSQDARDAARLLQLDVLLLAQEGELDEALRLTRGIVNAGRAVGDEPTLVSGLIRQSVRAIAVSSLERVLAQGEPSPAVLADLQRVLEEEEAVNLMVCGTRGERAGMEHLLANLQNGSVKMKDVLGPAGMGLSLTGPDAMEVALLTYSTANLKGQRAAMLRFMTQIVEATKLPPVEQAKRQKQLNAEVRSHGLFVRAFVPAVIKVTEADQRTRGFLRCAIVALAAERYRRAHGNWPASIQALVDEGLLQGVPTDPYDGAPLRYRVRDDRVVIYSIGHDLQDNGGTFDNKAGYTDGTDIGFTLWNVSQRRMLPLPAEEPPGPPPGQPGAEPNPGAPPPPGSKEPDQ